MPLYDFECPSCSAEYEVLFRRPEQRADYVCEECGSKGVFPATAATLIGPTDTNPLRAGGQVFTSQAQVRAWSKKTGNVIHSAGDSSFKNMVDRAENRANANAKKQGFRDRRDRLEHNTEQQKINTGKYSRKRIYSGT